MRVLFLKGGFGNNLFQVAQTEPGDIINGYFLKKNWLGSMLGWSYHSTRQIEQLFPVVYQRPTFFQFILLSIIFIIRRAGGGIEQISFLGQQVLFGYFQDNLSKKGIHYVKSFFPPVESGSGIAMHYRGGDFLLIERGLTAEYYGEALRIIDAELSEIFVLTSSADDYFSNVNIQGCNLFQGTPMEDFDVIRASSRVICSNSTFCLWACLVSEKSLVILPKEYEIYAEFFSSTEII